MSARDGGSTGLVVENLEVRVRGRQKRALVRDVSFAVAPGRILAVVGESGSGKTTTALSLLGATPPGTEVASGSSSLDGEQIIGASLPALRRLWRSRASYVPQDAFGALNPAFRVGTQLAEAVRASGRRLEHPMKEELVELLRSVSLDRPEESLHKYPHQFSGGQLQRVVLAIALASHPRLLVLDEPGTGLDVTVRAEVVRTLVSLAREQAIATVYVSHDLNLVADIADDLLVMYSGEIVEQGPIRDIVRRPAHPYSAGLLGSVLSIRAPIRPVVLTGRAPGYVVEGQCGFSDRCHFQIDACVAEKPQLLPDPWFRSRNVRCVRAGDRLDVSRQVSILEPKGMDGEAQSLLEVRDLSHAYRSGSHQVPSLTDVTFSVGRGSTVAIVGESGSGKTTIARCIAGLVPPVAGSLWWRGSPIAWPIRDRHKDVRKSIQIIFQNANGSLNPRHSIERLLMRPVKMFRPDLKTSADATHAIERALDEVQLSGTVMARRPSELSGGQRQRVAIARAFIADPSLVVADEIVTGQDVSVQAALLELVREIQESRGVSIIFISHDLAVVRSLAQSVIVLQEGKIVEIGSTRRVFENSSSDYTKTLLASSPESVVNISSQQGGPHPSENDQERGRAL